MLVLLCSAWTRINTVCSICTRCGASEVWMPSLPSSIITWCPVWWPHKEWICLPVHAHTVYSAVCKMWTSGTRSCFCDHFWLITHQRTQLHLILPLAPHMVPLCQLRHFSPSFFFTSVFFLPFVLLFFLNSPFVLFPSIIPHLFFLLLSFVDRSQNHSFYSCMKLLKSGNHKCTHTSGHKNMCNSDNDDDDDDDDQEMKLDLQTSENSCKQEQSERSDHTSQSAFSNMLTFIVMK